MARRPGRHGVDTQRHRHQRALEGTAPRDCWSRAEENGEKMASFTREAHQESTGRG